MKHLLATAALAVGFVLVALASGAHRRGAVVGAGISGVTALASMMALARFGRGVKPIKRALAVITVAFLARIVLVALGLVLVLRSGASVVGFIVAFFVPFFVFAAVEALYVHSLNRGTGPIA